MILLRVALARWARLVAGIGGGLTALLAATQARRWLATEREWTSVDARGLLADGLAAFAVVAAVAATLAAVETAVRLRRDGVLATVCVSAVGVRRLAAIAGAAAAATGAAIVVAAWVAAMVAEAPGTLARAVDGWRWQPWPDVPAAMLATGSPGSDVATSVAGASGGALAAAILAGSAGAAAVAAAFAFGATTNARSRLLPHLLALDALAVAAALWLAAPAAAVVAAMVVAAACWRGFAGNGPRRLA